MIKNINDVFQTINNHHAKDWLDNSQMKIRPQRDLIGDNLQVKEMPREENTYESFADFLVSSIQKVNDVQKIANKEIEKLATGRSKNIHETMLIMEKAEMAFKTMNTIRSKVIDAYKEIMKMQI